MWVTKRKHSLTKYDNMIREFENLYHLHIRCSHFIVRLGCPDQQSFAIFRLRISEYGVDTGGIWPSRPSNILINRFLTKKEDFVFEIFSNFFRTFWTFLKIPNVFLNPERQNLQVAKNVVEFFFIPKKNITSCRGFVEGTSRYPVYCLTPNSGGDIAASKTQKKNAFFFRFCHPWAGVL